MVAFDLSVTAILSVFVSDVSFTGRDVIWDFILEQYRSQWALGFGYGSFWGVGLDAPNLKADYNFIRVLTQAHNGYFDVLLAVGPIGLAMLLLFLLQITVLIGEVRRPNPQLYGFALFVFLFTVIHNLTDSNLVRGVSCLWIMLVVVAAAAITERNKSAVPM
jgi:O-antigen ligase